MKTFHKRAIAVALFAACVSRAAFAHAFLDKSDPKVGATLTASPTEIKIWFTDDVVPDKSFIHLFDAANSQIDKKDTHPDPDDKSILTVSVPTLSPGTYKVVWQALCPDSHQTSGTFEFTLKPSAITQGK
jgi:methionine-rich copper-binding protein CopC